MADFKIKSDIKLDPSEALAQLADLRKQFEETRARLTQPIPIQFAPVGMNDALSKVEKRMERLRATTPPSLSPARTGGATSPARAMEDTAAAAERTAAATSKAARNTGRLAEEAKKTLGAFSQLFVSVSKYILTHAPRWGTSLMKGMASGISSSASLLKSTVTGVLSGIRSIVGAGVSAVRSAMGALDPASQMQQYGITMEVLLKDANKAQARLAQLKTYARDTNFDIREVVEASNLMQAFGIHGNGLERLKLAGDAANAFGKDIREVITALNYLGSGRGGEAFESLARIGVTKEKLKPYGVQFNAQGALVTPTKKALNAVFKYFEKEYGGMTARMGRTWAGSLKQLGGEWTTALADGLKGALQPLANFVTSDLIPAVRAFGQFLKSQDFAKALSGPLAMMSGIMMYARRVMDPRTSSQGWGELKNLGKAFAESGERLMKAFSIIGEGFVGAIGKVFENFFGNGGMQSVLDAAYKGLLTVGQFFCDTFSIILSSFSDRFKSDLLVLAEKMNPFGDKTETVARELAEDRAFQRMLGDAGIGKKLQKSLLRMGATPVIKFGENGEILQQGYDNDVIRKAMHDVASPAVTRQFNALVAEEMGWTDNRGRQANFDKTLARGREFFSSVGTAFSINSQGVMQPIKDAFKEVGALGITKPVADAIRREVGFKQFDTARQRLNAYYDAQEQAVRSRYAGYQRRYDDARRRNDFEGMNQAAYLMGGAESSMASLSRRRSHAMAFIARQEDAYAQGVNGQQKVADDVRTNTGKAASISEDIDKKLVILTGQIANMNRLLGGVLVAPQMA